jgi:hypothetical protein
MPPTLGGKSFVTRSDVTERRAPTPGRARRTGAPVRPARGT